MPFTRPTLQQIVDRIQGDFTSRLGTESSVLRRAFTRVMARAYAGSAHLLYGYLDYISRQIMPDTAEDEELVRWANIFGLERREGTFADGAVQFTAKTDLVMPAGFLWQRSDGAQFQTTADNSLGGDGSTTQTVTALVQAVLEGEDGNTALAAVLTAATSNTSVQSDATVSTIIDDGTDQESIEDLRARLLAKIREKPQGGSKADYEQWALEVAGVTRVWVYGPGEIDDSPYTPPIGQVYVYFVRDGDGAGAAIIPSAGEITTVQDYIDDLRPVTANVTVSAPSAVTVNYSIALTPSGDAAVQAAIIAELTDLFEREGVPGGVLYLSDINEAISRATGEVTHTLTVPAANVVLAENEIAILGAPTWS